MSCSARLRQGVSHPFSRQREAQVPNCHSSAMAALVQSRMQYTGGKSGCSPDIATRVSLERDSKRSFGGDKSKIRSPGEAEQTWRGACELPSNRETGMGALGLSHCGHAASASGLEFFHFAGVSNP